MWNFTVPLDSNTTHKFGNTENTTLTYDGDISETETTTLTYMGDVEDIEDHIKKMENHPDLCKGIIHKPRVQIFGYFKPTFLVTFKKILNNWGIRTLNFSRKTTNVILSGLQTVDLIK